MVEIILAVGMIIAGIAAMLTAFAHYIRSDAKGHEIQNKTLETYDNRLNEMDERHQRDIQQMREEAKVQREESKSEIEKLRDRLRAVEAELNQQKGEKAVLERNLIEAQAARDAANVNLGKRDAEIAQLTVELHRRDVSVQQQQEKIEALTTRIGVLEAMRAEEKRVSQLNEVPKYAAEPLEVKPVEPQQQPGESAGVVKAESNEVSK